MSKHYETQDPQQLVNKILWAHYKEKRSKKRFKWFIRLVFAAILTWMLFHFLSFKAADSASKSQAHVGLVDLKGAIFEAQPANGDNFMHSLHDAYENPNLQALIVRIDSPGGSPVQADYMYNALKYFKQLHPKVKTYAVCMDICASAAYYVAAATDEIYANPSSIVGSIGVLYNGFGFVDGMKKVGVTRRLVTAGKYKGMLDPFSEISVKDTDKLKTMLDIIHQQFIKKVKEGRGVRLKSNHDLFSGLFWTGIQAKDLGLVDGFASSGQLARDIIKNDKIIDYTHEDSLYEQVSKSLGVHVLGFLPSSLSFHQGFQ